jgi:hypothetical protein
MDETTAAEPLTLDFRLSMVATYAISLFLIGLSGFMLDLHRRSWRAAQQDTNLADHERRYFLSQYRRRMQASGIIGLLGAAIGVHSLVPREPWPMVLYVLFLAGACVSIMLLAAIDAWSTRQYYARLRSEQLTAQIRLARELTAVRKSTSGDESSKQTV